MPFYRDYPTPEFEKGREPPPEAARNFPVTAGVVVTLVAVFAFEVFLQARRGRGGISPEGILGMEGIAESIQEALGRTNLRDLRDGGWWRPLAALFLHGGFLPVAANVIVLMAVGWTLEPVLGAARFFVVFALCGLAALATSLGYVSITEDPETRVWALGACGPSGALAGLIAFLLAYSFRMPDRELTARALGFLLFLPVLFLLFRRAPFNAAHAGGLLFGGVLGLAIPARSFHRPFWVWTTLHVLLVTALVFSLVVAVWNGLR